MGVAVVCFVLVSSDVNGGRRISCWLPGPCLDSGTPCYKHLVATYLIETEFLMGLIFEYAVNVR